MDKTRESTVKSLDDDNFREAMINVGQSLDMPGEIDKEEPKVIPKRNLLNILSKKTSVIVKNSNQK